MGLPKGRTNNRAGKPKGAINNITKTLREQLSSKFPGYHPVIAMADIALNSKFPIDIRLTAHKEVAKYTEPQLKAIEHKGDISLTQSFVIEKTYEADTKAD